MNDYKITYIIETLKTEHVRFLTADNETHARELFNESRDRVLLGQSNIKIIDISIAPSQDDMCYCTDNCC